MTSERPRMIRARGATAVLAAGSLLLLAGGTPGAQGRAPQRASQGLLVKFKPGATEAHRLAALARVNARLRAHFDQLAIDYLDLPSDGDALQASSLLQADPAVAYAQPNYPRHIVDTVPNDPAWTSNTMWGLNKISAPSAWSAFPPGAHDVVVAVIDTGINYLHPDLAASVWTNPGEIPGNGVDDDHDGYVDDVHGIDTINGDADPMDDNGHGTHTAGTIGAQGNNGTGVIGVAWNPQLLACKALDRSGNGTDATAISCFNYLIDQKRNRGINIRVTNGSWGFARDMAAPFPQAMKDAIDAAGAAGILSVFSAGNSGSSNDTAPFDPASFTSPSIVAVAASDESDARASFSNYGASAVDLAAPGVNIYSTYADGYAYSSGTSMAAPHVAGTLALMASLNPALTVDVLKSRLLAAVDPIAQWAGVTVTGGRLNLFLALQAATDSSISTSTLAGSGWSHGDVGATGVAGDASLSGGTFQVTGGGADVWGTADAFHFVYRALDGDGSIVARVAGIQNVSNWTKAGVMIRNSLSPSAAHGFMLVAASPVKGVPFQRRLADGATSLSTPGSQSTAPRWVKLVRVGSTITGYESADGSTWTAVGSDTFTMGQTVLVGLAVSSHVSGVNATATFDAVTVTTAPPPPPAPVAALPQGWTHGDIGATPLPGDASSANGTFTIKGSGADVWGIADAFHYAYTPLSGDGTIIARVAAVQQDVHAWVKAGVMIRESLTAGSAHAFMLVSAGKGVAFQRRVLTGDISYNTAGSFSTAPRWVKLTRSGNVFTAYESADGVAWAMVGTETIVMGANVYAGLAVTSHSTTATAICTFDGVVSQ